MASVNINVTNFSAWENTGIAAPCLVEASVGEVFVATETSLSNLSNVIGHHLTAETNLARLRVEGSGTLWVRRAVSSIISQITVTSD